MVQCSVRHIAVIGDLVDSRALPDRNAFQKRLSGFFTVLSQERADLESPYTITLGDEFQALYAQSQRLFADLLSILAHLAPNRVRIAIGVGEITTTINRRHAIGMDGSVFHAARDAMDTLKPEDESTIRLSISSPRNHPALELANRGLSVVGSLTRTWKKHTWVIARDAMDQRSVDETADALSITQRAVYKNMRTNGVRSVVAFFEHAAALINDEVRDE